MTNIRTIHFTGTGMAPAYSLGAKRASGDNCPPLRDAGEYMYDRNVKLPRYANSGVTEVWIENLEEDLLLVFRDPAGGAYQTCLILRPGDALSVAAFPDVVFKVEDFLG